MKKRRFQKITRFLLGLIPSVDPYHRPRLPFPRHSESRASSHPFISGDTFRAHCDHIFDETDAAFIPEKVTRGDSIFVNGAMLKHFFAYAHPKVRTTYILITHNTDYAIPGHYSQFLGDGNVHAWFTQNADRSHPRLHPIPIGLANAHWEHGNTDLIRSELPTNSPADKRSDYLAYLNFSRKRAGKTRMDIWNLFKDAGFCHVAEDRTYRQYLRDMKASRFVISPAGNGLDCHRHWEALLMGSIPIMKRSTIDNLFDDLPVLLVDDWQDVTPDFLLSHCDALKSRRFNMNKLYAPFWLDRIKQAQHQARAE